MRIEVIDGAFSVCKVKEWGSVTFPSAFTFVGKTDDEVSLVCPTENVPPDCLERDDGWSLFRLVGPLEFSLIGILAGIATMLADAKISIFAISTFNTDYFLVRKEKEESAATTLREHGYSIEKRCFHD